ncbi:sulfatase [candidate division KSB1 bacterium]|nr:sulfatase [candidate division KSB1 bacterium]
MKTRACSRRSFLKTSAFAVSAFSTMTCTASSAKDPNFIVIFCDDLGYGDLGTFGHPTIRTPNLDRMAGQGQKWTNFYVGASVCTPSRAALMTGRLPIRSGMCSDKRRVLFPDSSGGLPQSEITIAKALKAKNYTTACVGKWHLGQLPQYLPTAHGFDSYFGIPYSNDMDKVARVEQKEWENPKSEYFNVPLMRDTEIVERPADQTTITKRYTDETIKLIRANKEKKFFIYLAHNLPHVPLFRSKEFEGKSNRGLYGDVVQEIDDGVGRILRTLEKLRLAKNTMVVFTSDNGPWLIFNELGGSAGLLRGGKGGTYEGGMREPTIFHWPGRIKPGVVTDLGATMDLLPTLCTIAGAPVPDDRALDGYDLSPVLFEGKSSPRDIVFFYRGTRVFALRKGPFKAHFITKSEYGSDNEVHHDPPLLYHLEHDPSEKYNVADKYPDVIADIKNEFNKHLDGLVPGEDQLAGRLE